MKLHYSPGACSMSCHIALAEVGQPFQAQKVDFDHEHGAFEKLNPLGAVPVLELDDGRVLSQNAAIILHLSEKFPQANLMPPVGTYERAQAMQWLSFVTADLHKAFSPLFSLDTITKNAADKASVGAFFTERLHTYLQYADRALAGKNYLMGDQFTAVDGYLFTVFNWCPHVNVPTDEYRNLTAFAARVAARPSVQKVLAAEGLSK